MFFSSDGGATWSATGLIYSTVKSIFTSGTTILAGTFGTGIYLSNDYGTSWVNIDSNLTNPNITSLERNLTTIFAGTYGGGIFKRSLSEIVNCVAYYETSYDSVVNTFNLTIDSSIIANATGYHWDFGDGTSSTLASPTHTYTQNTIYNVCMKIYTASGDSCEYCHYIGKDYLGNIYRTNGFTLIVNNSNSTVGIAQSNEKEQVISIYPNPFTSQTNILFSNEIKNATIKIVDVLGKKTNEINFTGRQLIIEKGTMKEGIYFLQIVDKNKNIMNRKIIIQ